MLLRPFTFLQIFTSDLIGSSIRSEEMNSGEWETLVHVHQRSDKQMQRFRKKKKQQQKLVSC